MKRLRLTYRKARPFSNRTFFLVVYSLQLNVFIQDFPTNFESKSNFITRSQNFEESLRGYGSKNVNKIALKTFYYFLRKQLEVTSPET